MSTPRSSTSGAQGPRGPLGLSRVHAVTVAGMVVVTAVIDLCELLWFGYTAGWLVVTLVSAIALVASVALRRRRPATALAVAALGYAVACVISLSEPRLLPAMAQAALWVAVFSAIAEGTSRLRLTAIAMLGACVAMEAFEVIRMRDAEGVGTEFLIYDTVSVSFLPIVVVAIAETVRGRIRLATEQAEQAERLRRLDARAAVRDERLRLARELHDVVANRLSAVTIRITAAHHVGKGRGSTPEGEVLAEIGHEIGTALGELRSVLGTLRDDEDGVGAATPPSLRDVDLLAEEARRAGAQVDIVVSGEPYPLPSMVDLASYRIVQEALTNVARHAFPPHATVRLDYGPDQLRVHVEDDGVLQPGTRSASSGHGIIGIGERAALCGGWASAGPRPGGGWTVEAALPVKKDDS
ncbi:sensor histidine kinase [Streptomyces ossamyceticus]|uniref:sensor histidine kinase n=1 Tax=Streptomyces ossamyceticus TaxID=249581 RepID=UPI003429BFCF